MGSPLQNPLTEIMFFVRPPYNKEIVLDLRAIIRKTAPTRFSFTKDPFMADIIVQPIWAARNVCDFTEGAIIFQYGLAGETIDFWQYVWKKAKFVVPLKEIPYDGSNLLLLEVYEDLWQYLH